ncbi:hypothetical protein [Hyphomicrobium sp.]|jgi:hypothetical protein|uniref:hypothetical protein n=1 Tax=Hyphomicrobium sp. TaxID=82 RepID=UPI0035695B3E
MSPIISALVILYMSGLRMLPASDSAGIKRGRHDLKSLMHPARVKNPNLTTRLEFRTILAF